MNLTGLSVVGALGLFILAWIVKTTSTALFSPLRKIPGPWYAPLTHYILKWHVIRGRRLHYIHGQHLKYGSIVRIGPNEVDVSDVEAFKEIHRIGGGFLKSPWYNSFRTDMDVFSMREPKMHAARRKMFARPFANTSLRENWEDTVKQKAQITAAKTKAEALNGNADVLKWWTLITTDVIATLSFGDDFKALAAGEKTQYITDLEKVTTLGGIGAELNPLMSWIFALPLPVFEAVRKVQKRCDGYGDIAVTNARGEGNVKKSNIFSALFADNEKGSEGGISDKDLAIEATGFIVAGSGTTAITLTYLVWSVLRHPAIQQNLEEEVLGLGEDFTDSELEKLPVLNAIIDETLRLYGAAPGSLPRIVPAGGATLGGYYISGGTTVCTQAYTLHRDEETFPNATQFDYTRFLPSNPLTPRQKAAFNPFGAGSRTCLGLHLARMELRHAITYLFRECPGIKLSRSMTDEDMEIVNHFLISPKGSECNVTLRH